MTPKQPYPATTHAELQSILGDTPLKDIRSEGRWSRYEWECGCRALRNIDTDRCTASWCAEHDQA
jgi:hypothetical protein